MANAIYPVWKANIQQATAAGNDIGTAVNTPPAATYVSLLSPAYSYVATHATYSQASANAIADATGFGQQITGSAVNATTGVFSGNNVTWIAVASGSTVQTFVIYRRNSGANSTWPLIAFFDAGTSTPPNVPTLPVNTNGGNITITWSGSGIFLVSDRRVKNDVQQIGWLGPFAEYEYRYAWGPERYQGVMAQDVEQALPEAVAIIDGIKRVNYTRLAEWIG